LFNLAAGVDIWNIWPRNPLWGYGASSESVGILHRQSVISCRDAKFT